MNLINILRYIRGYVKFTVEGGFIERFINLCAENNIRIFNLEPHIGKTEVCILAKNFFRLRSIVRKSGVRLRIVKKAGLPFFLKRHKHRAVLIFGIFFYIASIFLMNQFVWFIDVEGTQTVSHAQIMSVLEQYGLKTGAYARNIDAVALSRNGVNHFNGKLMWMSVNIKGSKAVIEVRDYVDEHEDATYGDPCNIVADFDGTILSVEIFNGDRETRAGNAVKKGDLLISGVIQNTDMSASYLEARGKITALHNVSYNKAYNCDKKDFRQYNGYKTHQRLNFLWLSLPLYLDTDKNSDELQYNKFLTHKELTLPFGFSTVTDISSQSNTQCSYSLLTALDSYAADCYYKFRNTNILTSKTTVSKNGKSYIINSDMECIDFIGTKSKIYVDKE